LPLYDEQVIHAAKALAHKNADKAVALLRETSPYELGAKQQLLPIYERGQAYLMLHNGSAAAPEFQRIVDHPGIVGMNPIGALARACALQCDTAKARDAYQDVMLSVKPDTEGKKLEKRLRKLQHKLTGVRAAAKALDGSVEREVVRVKKRVLPAAGRAAMVKVAKKRWAKARKQAKKVAG
jgi:hypothetical protein